MAGIGGVVFGLAGVTSTCSVLTSLTVGRFGVVGALPIPSGLTYSHIRPCWAVLSINHIHDSQSFSDLKTTSFEDVAAIRSMKEWFLRTKSNGRCPVSVVGSDQSIDPVSTWINCAEIE